MANETELLPCPFCGSEWSVDCDQNENGSWYVGCLAHQDHGCGLGASCDFTSKEAAIKAWNTRPSVPTEVVWLYLRGKEAINRLFSELNWERDNGALPGDHLAQTEALDSLDRLARAAEGRYAQTAPGESE